MQVQRHNLLSVTSIYGFRLKNEPVEFRGIFKHRSTMSYQRVSVSKAFCREQLHVRDKICELLRTRDKSKDRKTEIMSEETS